MFFVEAVRLGAAVSVDDSLVFLHSILLGTASSHSLGWLSRGTGYWSGEQRRSTMDCDLPRTETQEHN